ncbi:glycosyltransferase [Pseudomonas asplenii]|uniref:glycosyltransferase n=1 Tax=Pseudomonas asplenii TaxID=53407 RepID=UPI001ED95200|nr:glycosyltransferase [Pseudomonas fuscovaginae]
MMASTLLFIVNDPAFFISHRLAIAEKAKKDGYVVHVATMDGVAVKDVVEKGFHHHIIPLSRSGRNLFFEFLTFFSILKLLWRIKPDLLHLVTIKPVIYGGLAARLAPVKGVVAASFRIGFCFFNPRIQGCGFAQACWLSV